MIRLGQIFAAANAGHTGLQPLGKGRDSLAHIQAQALQRRQVAGFDQAAQHEQLCPLAAVEPIGFDRFAQVWSVHHQAIRRDRLVTEGIADPADRQGANPLLHRFGPSGGFCTHALA